MNNREDSQDILQETFIEAFQSLGTVRDKKTFGAWIRKIAVNKSLNRLQRNKISWLDLNESTEEFIYEEYAVDEEAFEGQIQVIAEHIQLLPDEYRTVLCLYLLEDYSHEEIAGLLQIPHATVRTRYTRAKARLIKSLKKNSTHE